MTSTRQPRDEPPGTAGALKPAVQPDPSAGAVSAGALAVDATNADAVTHGGVMAPRGIQGSWRRLGGVLQRVLQRGVERGLTVLLPSRCLACGIFHEEDSLPASRRSDLCGVCAEQLTPADAAKEPRDPAQDAVALYAYAGVMASLITRAKYGPDLSTALALGRLAAESTSPFGVVDGVVLPPPLAITWVPGHWTRVAQRGFDLPALLAEALATSHGLPLVSVLRAGRRDPKLASLSNREARAAVVQGRFSVTAEVNRSTEVHDEDSRPDLLLVDDVITTSATLTEAKKTLTDAGWRVRTWALAATPAPDAQERAVGADADLG